MSTVQDPEFQHISPTGSEDSNFPKEEISHSQAEQEFFESLEQQPVQEQIIEEQIISSEPHHIASHSNQHNHESVAPSSRKGPLPPWVIWFISGVAFVGVFAGLVWLGVRNLTEDTQPVEAVQATPPPSSLLAATPAPPTPAPAKAHVLTEDETLAAAEATETPSPSPSPTVKPTPLPSAVDLSIEDIALEDSQNGAGVSTAYAGLYVNARAVLKNVGSQDSKTFASYWVINGSTVGQNSNGKLKAKSTASYDDVNSVVSPAFFLREGSNSIQYVVDSANVNSEAVITNNSKQIVINTQNSRIDLEPQGVTYFQQGNLSGSQVSTISAGMNLTAAFPVKNNGSDKTNNWLIKVYVNNTVVKETRFSAWLGAGETKNGATYDFTVPNGTTTWKIEVNTPVDFPETSISNNSKTYTLSL